MEQWQLILAVIVGIIAVLLLTYAILAAVGHEGVITNIFSNWFSQAG